MDPSPYLVQKPELDQARAFMAYCLTGGHVGRTAIICRTSNDIIESLAHDYNWEGKISGIVRMDTEAGVEEQRTLNRISNFVASQRLKEVVQNVIDRFHKDPEAALHFCIKVKRIPGTEEEDVTFDPKALESLAKTLETCNNMSYRALGDKIAKEADAANGAGTNPQQFALELYKAMARRLDETAPRVVLPAVVSKVIEA